jgi:hypothetical protein
MSKDKPGDTIKPLNGAKCVCRLAPLAFAFCCGPILEGCRSMVTEAEVRLCVAEPGIPLPPECLTKNQVSKEARDQNSQ